MVTTNIKYVLDLIEREQLKFFKITGADNKSIVLKQDNPEVSVTEAYNMLEDFLSNCEAGIINIKLSEVSDKEKGNGGSIKGKDFTFRVRVGASTSRIAGTDANTISGVEKALMHENYNLKLQLELMEQKHQQKEELRKLEEKIEGLQNSDPLEKYAPLIQHFMGGFFKQPAQVAGIAGHEEETPANDKKTRITKAVNRILKVDPDFADNIELLANFAEKSPDKYKNFVPMLKMM